MGNDNPLPTTGLATALNPDRVSINIRQAASGGYIINFSKTLYGITEEHVSADKLGVIELVEKLL